MNKRTDRNARLAGFGAGIVFGLYWIPLRRLEEVGFPGVWAVVLFSAVPMIVLLPALVARRSDFSFTKRAFHMNGLLLGTSIALYASAYVYTDVVRTVMLFYLTPIWGFLLARVVIGDPITVLRWGAIVCGLAGMWVILDSDAGFPRPSNAGDWMALASGIIWAVASLRMLMDDENDAVSYCISFFLWSAVVALLIAFIATSFNVLEPAAWSNFPGTLIWFVPVSLLLLIPGGFAVVYSASKLNPGVVGLLFMAEISIATISAAILIDEPFGRRELVGILLVTIAGVIEPLGEKVRSRR